MNTLPTSAFFVAFLPMALACDVQGKQIGQLDGEDDVMWEADTFEDVGGCGEARSYLISIFAEQVGQHCAMVVLLDYETHEISNWNLECESGELGMSVDEARALTSWGGKDISEPEGEPADDRSFIFYSSMEDAAGVGWVSNHTKVLFDASIVAGGVGEIHHPSIQRDPSELGSDCQQPGDAFEWRGYDLTEDPVVTDWQLDNSEAMWAALFDTAVWKAVVADADVGPGNPTLDVLAYPRTIAPFDPSTGEYVVVIEWRR